MTGLNFGDAASQDIRGAVQYLKTRSTKVGVTGFCMGGALTLLSVCMAPEIDAGVVWYGCPPLEYIDAAKKIPSKDKAAPWLYGPIVTMVSQATWQMMNGSRRRTLM